MDDVIEVLASTGVRGIELRMAPGEIVEPSSGPRKLERLRRTIAAAGIRLTALASYVRVARAGDDEPVVAELTSALETASALQAPAVRVFPGAPTVPDNDLWLRAPTLAEPTDEVDARASRRLSLVAETAQRLQVVPLLETHDSHPTGADVARVVSAVDGPVGVIWDLMHPWRSGEDLSDTWSALAPWLTTGAGSVQLKDAKLPGDPTPCLVGDGSLPCEEFGELLVSAGYHGTVTLELEAAWYPAAPDFAEALASAQRWSARHWTLGVLR